MQTVFDAKRLWHPPGAEVMRGDAGRLPRGDDPWLMSYRMNSAEGKGDKEDGTI